MGSKNLCGGNGESERGCERMKKEVFQVQTCQPTKFLTAFDKIPLKNPGRKKILQGLIRS
jgi:hypothetical protein